MSLADKYDITVCWDEPCRICGKDVRMCNAVNEVRGPYHDGCAGYPFCSCAQPHQGDCNLVTFEEKGGG